MVWLTRTYYSLLKSTSKIVWYGLTVHIFSLLKKITSKIFKNYLSQSNSSEFRKFRAIRPHSPRITQNLHILLTYSILCFRHLLQQRTLHNSSEFRKFRAICPHSPRITQNSHILLTYSILCFRHLLRQRTLQNSSELCRFCMIRPHSPRITRIPHTWHYNLLSAWITVMMLTVDVLGSGNFSLFSLSLAVSTLNIFLLLSSISPNTTLLSAF